MIFCGYIRVQRDTKESNDDVNDEQSDEIDSVKNGPPPESRRGLYSITKMD